MMWEFRLDSVGDLKTLARSLSVEIDVTGDLSPLKRPVTIGALTAPNSMGIQPMEGCDGDSCGRPGPLTVRRYTRFASGGAGLIWSEAIAVVPEGRANPRQLWLNDQSKDAFAQMLKSVRQAATARFGKNHRPIIVAQLTHSGRYSKPEGVPAPLIPEHDPYRDVMAPQFPPDSNAAKALAPDWPVITDDYLDKLQAAFVKAARLAFEVGFDAVDVKACHGYLISELLASRSRPGKYGGSFENRTRFLLEVIEKIFAAVGRDKLVGTRMGLYDAIPYPYGWAVDQNDYTKPDLSEPRRLFKLLQEKGVRLVDTTVGNPYYNPHVGRPFNEPIAGGYDEPEHPLTGVARLINLTGQMQKEFPTVSFVGAGYSWLRHLMPNVAAASLAAGKATFVSCGRMGFAYPDFAADIMMKDGLDPMKVCVGCSACTQIMRDGGMAGCVVRDNEVYGPIYEHGRMSNRDNLARLAKACRNCQDAMCRRGCPAGIDIAGFIHKFLDGDDRGAYEIIRQSNILPEVCAWLCPVEEQCQGHCLQGFIGDGPLPIADIQRYLSEQANRKGWSKVRIPQNKTGRKVAVIGAGSAGLTCAARLLESGHSVTVFDQSREVGGTIEWAILGEKQGTSLRNEVKGIFDGVPGDRLEFRLGTGLTSRFNLDKATHGFDSVFIAMGLNESKTLYPKGKLKGLWSALGFLAAVKQGRNVSVAGKRVAVIGGGNTGMDVAVAARKAGARTVYMICFESFRTMPAWQKERITALEKDVSFLNLFMPKRYISRNGRVKAVRINHVRLAEPDATGFCAPIEIKGSSIDVEVDVIVEALGQKAPDNLKDILAGVELTNRNLVAVRPGTHATSRPGVFAGGDIINGGLTVVRAVADGMAAADEINAFLSRQ